MRTTVWLPPLEHQTRISQAIDALEKVVERSAQSEARAAVLVPALLNSRLMAER